MKEILANCTEDEVRVAIVEDGRLADLFIERLGEKNIVGNVYKGRVVSVLEGMQAAFVDIGISRNGYLPFSELTVDKSQLCKTKPVLVQVTKGPLGTKGSKVTQQISLPGHYLVYIPSSFHIGISKNINVEKERTRLKSIIEEIKPPTGGFIVRSEGAGKEKDVFKREIKYLIRLWEIIRRKFNTDSNISLIHRDLGLVFKTVRDYLNEDISAFFIDSKSEYEDTLDFVEMVSPKFKSKIHLYKGKTPIFEMNSAVADKSGMNNVEQQIKNIQKQKIKLPSGGYIIIQEAETLCAIDVNSGRFTKGGSHDEIIFKTNIEAIYEIASQLRLRNIGGIIVIDLIDMKRSSDRKKIFRLLLGLMKKDKAKTEILPVTKLGLIEMTRERKTESMVNFLSETCPYCAGSGNVLSRETMAIKIKKEILKLVTRGGEQPVRLVIHPDIAEVFDEEYVKKIEKSISRKIIIESNARIHREDYKIILGN
ncbi:MAG: Rne/Rng family ribonuclease [Elusimicrobia bacterium]|nr:Rne/Rng family ribonuclease [Elusimicrobiota bacterium]